MKEVKEYIEQITGETLSLTPLRETGQENNLPLFITQLYHLFAAQFFGRSLVFMQLKDVENFSIQQLAKHQNILYEHTGKLAIAVFDELASYQRKRLIEKKIQFIVPFKQCFVPYLLTDLQEQFVPNRKQKDYLLPVAQVILLRYLLNKFDHFKLEEYNFKTLAKKLNYSAMAISKAATNLEQLGLCTHQQQGKDKYLVFEHNKSGLWQQAQAFLVSPVLKQVYVDELPRNLYLPFANLSALPEYTEMNPSKQLYYAIEKNSFYKLQKAGELKNLNEHEGKIALEVWKYNPDIFAELLTNDSHVVDHLSLYLSIKDSQDERTYFAMDKLIDQQW